MFAWFSIGVCSYSACARHHIHWHFDFSHIWIILFRFSFLIDLILDVFYAYFSSTRLTETIPKLSTVLNVFVWVINVKIRAKASYCKCIQWRPHINRLMRKFGIKKQFRNLPRLRIKFLLFNILEMITLNKLNINEQNLVANPIFFNLLILLVSNEIQSTILKPEYRPIYVL